MANLFYHSPAKNYAPNAIKKTPKQQTRKSQPTAGIHPRVDGGRGMEQELGGARQLRKEQGRGRGNANLSD